MASLYYRCSMGRSMYENYAQIKASVTECTVMLQCNLSAALLNFLALWTNITTCIERERERAVDVSPSMSCQDYQVTIMVQIAECVFAVYHLLYSDH